MKRNCAETLVLLLGFSTLASAGQRHDQSPSPAEQYKALLREFNTAAHGLHIATNDAERKAAAARGYDLTPRLLALVEKYPEDPLALDALVQVINQEIWLENNTTHAGYPQPSPQVRALAILARDHIRSDRLDYACWRTSYGFREECETFLRKVLKESPHKQVQGRACLHLAQFLQARLQRLDVLKGRPEMANRYEGIFGKDYLDALQRRDRTKANAEIEALYEKAAAEYAQVKLHYAGTVGEQAKRELFALRHLAVGKMAEDIEGMDQEGKRFRLSDYRGKVVLLYFWSEY